MIGPEDLPAVNATLNGTSALLLMAGYAAIRRLRVGIHKTCMLTALGVSAAFLASYLYYHIVVRHGQPTTFTAEGAPRLIYRAILYSHMVLAVATVPLAIITAYLGLRDRIDKHRRLARWTYPIWLYVSVTGVLVYWMLYHLYPPSDG
jgi:putative membrane protein